jgi:23S rRNA (guanine2535-N1)-methyltransferase
MPYKFAIEQRDYSDLASGRVLYALPGHPAFPIRLASEIFQRCVARCAASGNTQRQIVYDPCCGAAYHLSTLAYEHWHFIQEIIASDIDCRAVEIAQRNLGLLTPEGLSKRMRELTDQYRKYGKASHQAALKSAERLHQQVGERVKQHPLRTRAFQASAFDAQALVSQLGDTQVDIVLTDVPYGQHSEWQGTGHDHHDQPLNEVSAMLTALQSILHVGSVVAVVSNKQQKPAHNAYERVERFQLGKRQVTLLKPLL